MRVGRELLPGIFLACVLQQTKPIYRRSHAKGGEEPRRCSGFFMCGPWRKSTLLMQIALVTNVNGFSSLLDSLARVLAAKCLQMSRNVYKCIRMSRQFQFFGTLFCVLPNSSSPSLMDTAWTIWGISQRFSGPLSPAGFLWARAVASQFVRLECPQSGPSLWAHKGYLFDSGGLTRPSPKSMQLSWFGRPKSTQVDPSRRVFSFFWDFFLDVAVGYSSRFRQPHEVCSNSLRLPWVRAGCDGLCRRFSFLQALTCLRSQAFPRRLL